MDRPGQAKRALTPTADAELYEASNGQALVAVGATFDKHSGQLVITATAELYTP